MKLESIGTFGPQPPVIGTFASASRALWLQPMFDVTRPSWVHVFLDGGELSFHVIFLMGFRIEEVWDVDPSAASAADRTTDHTQRLGVTRKA